MSDFPAQFIYVCTQHGVENACKQQILEQWPKFRFSFSRPGFLTFKVTDPESLSTAYDLKNVFVRATGFTGARLNYLNEIKPAVDGDTEQPTAQPGTKKAKQQKNRYPTEMTEQPEFRTELRELLQNFDGSSIHVWSRDLYSPGDSLHPVDQHALKIQTYTPGQSRWLAGLIDAVTAAANEVATDRFTVNQVAARNEKVLDLILVDPAHVWSGTHTVLNSQSRWPGGIPAIEPCEDMISRAWLKMNEAILWSRLPLEPGDHCAEIGAAPGGSCQALLDLGAKVIGIDPAKVDARLLENKEFTYLRGRGSEIKCRDLKAVKWLFVDTNVAPTHTLDTVERIVSNEAVRIRGMLLTIKLIDPELASEIPALIKRVRDWGFGHVRVRQLANNRQEFCLAALRNKAMLRFGDRRAAKSGQPAQPEQVASTDEPTAQPKVKQTDGAVTDDAAIVSKESNPKLRS